MSRAAALASRAFEGALSALERQVTAQDLGDPVTLGRRAALLAVAERVPGGQIGPLYDAEQVAILLGVGSRKTVSQLARRGRLLALKAAGRRRLYPAFQFRPNGRPYPELAQVLAVFAGAVETAHTVACWLVSPQPLLDEATPAAWMRGRRDPEPLLEAARRAAAALAS
jgi:hypothetical protein